MRLCESDPGVSLKIMKTFKCVEVEGEWWLVADMRLKCYEGDWYGYAAYAFLMGLVFTVGLPTVILVIMLKNRLALAQPSVVEKWGFLYEVGFRPSVFFALLACFDLLGVIRISLNPLSP